jgi:hypothetical protein
MGTYVRQAHRGCEGRNRYRRPSKVICSCFVRLLIVNPVAQEAGIDVRLGELGGAIQETMESYEVEVGGKVYPGLYFTIPPDQQKLKVSQ